MNRFCFQSGGLCEPLRGPAGGGAEQALNSLGSQDQKDRIDQSGLSDAGSAHNDGGAAG
jgi:hypothetical protein